MTASNPYVFIIGCPRSGTTLFRHMLDAHPLLAITPEAHWIPIWFEERRGLAADGTITPELLEVMLQHPKFAFFGIGRERLLDLAASEPGASYARFVSRIFDAYGELHGKVIVGNKTPDSARRIHTLHALWPQARFVHLIRDGRDAVLSLINWPDVRSKRPGTFPTWQSDPLVTAALWWELNVRCGREGGAALGPRLYHELRYESLIANPAAEFAALSAFLEVPDDEDMLRYYQERQPGEGKGPAWRPVTAGLRNWRTQMAREDVERFEATAGGLLDDLGYERAVTSPSPAARFRAASVRTSLAEALQNMTRPRPPTSPAARQMVANTLHLS